MITINYPHELPVKIDGETYENYLVTRDGKIFSLYRNKYLSNGNDNYYYQVVLSNNTSKRCSLLVHRIVASTFIPNSNHFPIVNHKDGNIHNNHENNLEWCSAKQNSQHAHNTGLQTVYKRPVVQYTLKGEKIAEYGSIVEASKLTGISNKSICNVCREARTKCNGFRWAYKGKELKIKPYAHCRKVNQLDFDTKELVRTFESAKEAAIHIGVAPSWMAKCCRTNFVCKGFMWQYAPEIPVEIEEYPDIHDTKMYNPLEIDGKIIDGYYISRKGEIWSQKRKKFLTQTVCHGYYAQCISHDKKLYTIRTHRHVALSFVSNPHNYTIVNHKDGNKLNNDAENLEWCTPQQNSQHAHDTGLSKGIGRPVTQFSLSGEKLYTYNSVTEAAKSAGVLHQTIYQVCIKKMYKAGGYRWTYGDEEDTIHLKKTHIKLVNQIDPNNMKIIEVHESVNMASTSIGCKPNRIYRACRHGNVCEGYIWKYGDV